MPTDSAKDEASSGEESRDTEIDLRSSDVEGKGPQFNLRARMMRSVPFVLRGAYQMAIRVSMQVFISDVEAQSEVQTEKGWKIFFTLAQNALVSTKQGRCGAS